MQSTTENKVGLALAVLLALATFFLSPDFVAENFSINPEAVGTIKLISYLVSVAIGAYNGYQINAKSKGI